jgi:uncharacterized protein (DUF433 family)
MELIYSRIKGAINLSAGGHAIFLPVSEVYLERIEWSVPDLYAPQKFYPFVYEASSHEPKIISLAPAVAAGRPVIDGTGVSTAVIASRFFARDSVESLAREYELVRAPDRRSYPLGGCRSLDAQQLAA